LQHLGHPIANDPNYGGDMWYGNPEGREACKIAQARLDVINDVQENNIVNDTDTPKTSSMTTTATDVPATEEEVQKGISSAVQAKDESIHDFIRRTCVWCARCRAVGGEDRAVLEFLIRSPGIWLHALQYSFATTLSGGSVSPSNGKDSGETNKEIVQTFRAPLPSWHDLCHPSSALIHS
jgi:hypothetical protein